MKSPSKLFTINSTFWGVIVVLIKKFGGIPGNVGSPVNGGGTGESWKG